VEYVQSKDPHPLKIKDHAHIPSLLMLTLFWVMAWCQSPTTESISTVLLYLLQLLYNYWIGAEYSKHTHDAISSSKLVFYPVANSKHFILLKSQGLFHLCPPNHCVLASKHTPYAKKVIQFYGVFLNLGCDWIL